MKGSVFYGGASNLGFLDSRVRGGNWVDFGVFWGLDSDIGVGFDFISFLFLFFLVFWGFVLCRYGEFKGVGGFAASAIGEAVWRDEADICCGAD